MHHLRRPLKQHLPAHHLFQYMTIKVNQTSYSYCSTQGSYQCLLNHVNEYNIKVAVQKLTDIRSIQIPYSLL